MKVYLQNERACLGMHNIIISPGSEHPETTEFFDGQGNPIVMTISFKYGMAEVPKNIGRYLVDKKIASTSKILLN